MTTYRIYQVDAFTRNRFKGNPAGVVANADGLDESQMQAIARELNNAETAFILPPAAPDHDVWVRFFTPTTEVPSCGHATISAHYVRALENDLPTCTIHQRIGIGILPVDIIRTGDDYRIIMTQGAVEIGDPLGAQTQNDILDALGLTREDLDGRCPIQIASTGHSKVMIGIATSACLNALNPDMQRLTRISHDIGCNGYFVFTFDTDQEGILTSGRMFAPAIGIAEDPVTGNANGPLGAYLVHHRLLAAKDGVATFQGLQGVALGRPGIVTVTVEVEAGCSQKVQVGGEAVIAFQTQIEL